MEYTDYKDIVEVAGIIFSMVFSIVSIIRSSKISQNNDIKEKFEHQSEVIENLTKVLQDHVKEDAEVQTELRADLKNAIKMMDRLDGKMDKVVEKL